MRRDLPQGVKFKSAQLRRQNLIHAVDMRASKVVFQPGALLFALRRFSALMRRCRTSTK
jgi:hypothetical protein